MEAKKPINGTEPLASRLREAFKSSNVTLEDIAARTKVPDSTLLALLGEPINAVLPARVYLRGHLGLVAREIGLDEGEAASLFDQTYPAPASSRDSLPELSRLSPRMLAVSAGLAGISILAIILAFKG